MRKQSRVTGSKKSTLDITAGNFDSASKRRAWVHAHGRRLAVLACIIAVVVIGLVAWLVHRQADKAVLTKQISNKEYALQETNRLKREAPAANAPVEDKINQAEALMYTQYRAGLYKDALASYQQLQELLGGTAPTDDSQYVLAAQIYAKLGDVQSASKTLDKAQAIDEKIADPEGRTMSLHIIQNIREELAR